MSENTHYDRAVDMYEQALESVRGYVDDAICATEDLSILLDGFICESQREKVDELIAKILINLEKII